MKIRWTERAARNLISIRDYIAKENPNAAARVAEALLEATAQLERFPQSGRAGRIAGTRELVVPGLPYIFFYRIVEEAILIAAVHHTSRRWPKKL